jgi:hypothetical protein
MSNTAGGGRFGNQFIRNISIHHIAKKYDLFVIYTCTEHFKTLGIDLFVGNKTFETTKSIDDEKVYELITNPTLELDHNISVIHTYCQSKLLMDILYEYLHREEIQTKIIQANKFNYRYQKNNDVFVHVRLGDVHYNNPGFEYYDKVLSKLSFENKFISSDSLHHPICQQLIQKYNLQPMFIDEVETIQFASTCKYIVLSHGTFSSTIGYLSYFSDIFYPKYESDKMWYSDLFSIPGWNEVTK